MKQVTPHLWDIDNWPLLKASLYELRRCKPIRSNNVSWNSSQKPSSAGDLSLWNELKTFFNSRSVRFDSRADDSSGDNCGICRSATKALNSSLKSVGLMNLFLVDCYKMILFPCLYYYMRNFCNLIGLEQWYFSIINNYSLKSRWIVAKYLPSRESGEVNIPKATIHRDWEE